MNALRPGQVEHVDRGPEIVSAMALRHAAHLPEAGFESLSQGCEALREADLDGFDVGVGQDEVIDQASRPGREPV